MLLSSPPLFIAMGCSLVHIGVVFVINIMIGMITTPFGMALYTACGVCGCDLKKVVKRSLPFTAGCIIILFLVSYCPMLVLALPRALGYAV